MSKNTLLIFLLATSPLVALSQNVQFDTLSPHSEYENILVRKLAGDSLTTTFVIWIKKEVKPHYHVNHSENIFVLNGQAIMTLDNQTFRIKKNSLVFIPKGSVHSVTVIGKKPLKVISIQSPLFDGSDRVFVTDPKN